MLAGKVWVANFIFTSCQAGVPAAERAHGARSGERARHLGPDFHLVSISVDPERDTPAKLAEYAARYGANPIALVVPRPAPMEAIQATVVDGFKVGAGKERSAGADGGAEFWEIFHGENLVLVDRQLRIRGYFDATPEGSTSCWKPSGASLTDGSSRRSRDPGSPSATALDGSGARLLAPSA